MKGGIYLIKNIRTGMVYVGSSVLIEKRWRSHIGLLNRNKHENIHLQRAWNKYGESCFCFIILERTEKFEKREQFWMDIFNSLHPKFGYNIVKASGPNKLPYSVRQKISKSMTGRTIPKIVRTKIKSGMVRARATARISNRILGKAPVPVMQTDLNGKLLKLFPSISEAGRQFSKYARVDIIKCCKGTRSSAYGFKWKLTTSNN